MIRKSYHDTYSLYMACNGAGVVWALMAFGICYSPRTFPLMDARHYGEAVKAGLIFC